MIENIKNGLLDLFRNKLRFFLTIGGIAIGVLSIYVISTIGEVGKSTIDDEMTNMGLDNIVVSANMDNITGLNECDLQNIRDMKYVENAMPLMRVITNSIVKNEEVDCLVWGVNEDADKIIQLEAIYGRLINRGDVLSGAKVCVIDEGIAISNYKRANIVGKTIRVNVNGVYEDYTVVGIVKNGVSLLQSMLGDIIPEFVYIPYSTMQSECSKFCFDQIAVKLSGENRPDIDECIERAVMTGREYDTNLSIDNLLNQKDQLNGIMDIVTLILTIIAGISLVVSGLSIMTVMMVAVSERTREIGIKKSIGATNQAILCEFLVESGMITLIGGLSGALIGVIVSVVGCLVLKVPIYIDFSLFVEVLVFSMVIGLVFGVYPAYSAATLKPVDALQHK